MCLSLSHVQLFVTPWTVTREPPLSMGFARQEYWSGLLFPSPGDFLDPGIESGSPALQTDSLPNGPCSSSPGSQDFQGCIWELEVPNSNLTFSTLFWAFALERLIDI